MTGQMPLPLSYRGGPGQSRFFVSDANRSAVAQIDQWREWPEGGAALLGPEGSGKSHLARLTSQRAGKCLVVVEDADQDRDEAGLFHLANRARNGGAALLITARTPPASWTITLADLGSRVRSLPILRIEEPDEALMPELLAKALRARGVVAPPDVLSYVALRLERRYAAIHDAAARLDAAALAMGRNLSVPLARRTLFDQED